MDSNLERILAFGKRALNEYTNRMKIYVDGDTLVTEAQASEGEDTMLDEAASSESQDIVLLDKIKLQLLELRVSV